MNISARVSKERQLFKFYLMENYKKKKKKKKKNLKEDFIKRISFPHTPAESKFFLPLVFTKMLLSAKGMKKNSILTSASPRASIYL